MYIEIGYYKVSLNYMYLVGNCRILNNSFQIMICDLEIRNQIPRFMISCKYVGGMNVVCVKSWFISFVLHQKFDLSVKNSGLLCHLST